MFLGTLRLDEFKVTRKQARGVSLRPLSETINYEIYYIIQHKWDKAVGKRKCAISKEYFFISNYFFIYCLDIILFKECII